MKSIEGVETVTQLRRSICNQRKTLGGLFTKLNKCKAEWKRFGVVIWWDDEKCDAFKIAKRKIETNQDINGGNG